MTSKSLLELAREGKRCASVHGSLPRARAAFDEAKKIARETTVGSVINEGHMSIWFMNGGELLFVASGSQELKLRGHELYSITEEL